MIEAVFRYEIQRRRIMKNEKGWRISLPIVLLLFLMVLVESCQFKQGVPQWSGSGFLRKEFLEYRGIAIFSFEGDDSGEVTDAFIESFRERFPQISIIGPQRVLEVLRSEGLDPKELDESARAKISSMLGTQALITGNVYYPSIVRWLLQVVIFDTETGRVMGRSLVEINFMGAMGIKEGARFSVEKLTLW
jgi:hypothetical protein